MNLSLNRSGPIAPPQQESEASSLQSTSLNPNAILDGLCHRPPYLPTACLYDAEGSRLFQRIMHLPEYYLTRSEREILETHGAAVAAKFRGQRVVVVDLGAGDGTKTAVLLSQLLRECREVRYAAVDVSAAALTQLQAYHEAQFPSIGFSAHLADYAMALSAIREAFPSHQKLALFLGSNIGNLCPAEAVGLLASWQKQLDSGGHLLVGFDLVKDPRVLQAAYDDALGVTAAFNLNMLRRLNRELGCNFDLSGFKHHACFSPEQSRMESYLISLRRQVVNFARESIVFEPWDAIRTEVAYKYRKGEVPRLAKAAGFSEAGSYCDSRRWFVDSLLRADGNAQA